MPMYFNENPLGLILVIGAIVIGFIASGHLQRVYTQFSKVPTKRMMTGAETAAIISRRNGLDVQVERGQGVLTDHYDPRTGIIRLSPAVYDGTSVAAVSIAAHEMGHALQHHQGYAALNFRNELVPVVNIASRMWMYVLLLGFIVGGAGNFMINAALIMFGLSFLFQLVTLPVEFNASNRALAQLTDNGIIGSEEAGGTKKVLGAAAMTYVAATLSSLAMLVRILLVRDRRR